MSEQQCSHECLHQVHRLGWIVTANRHAPRRPAPIFPNVVCALRKGTVHKGLGARGPEILSSLVFLFIFYFLLSPSDDGSSHLIGVTGNASVTFRAKHEPEIVYLARARRHVEAGGWPKGLAARNRLTSAGQMQRCSFARLGAGATMEHGIGNRGQKKKKKGRL